MGNTWGNSLVLQPADRGTAAGILLPVLDVYQSDHSAVVVVLPSDHAVSDCELFTAGIRKAIWAVEREPGLLVLGGVAGDTPQTDYGWIVPERGPGKHKPLTVHRVRRFVEKPLLLQAQALLQEGALWNTFVLVGRARTIIELVGQEYPALTAGLFDYLTLEPGEREAWLAANFSRLPCADLSADVLESCGNLAVLEWPSSLGWVDLGTPERLMNWLNDVGEVHQQYVWEDAARDPTPSGVCPSMP
jgi:mannose-1-phosphate guanylyltransferase